MGTAAISVGEMQEIEEKAFASGITVLELMERAGRECAKLIESKRGTGNRIVIFCGPGNNGGDGLVCARYLAEKNDVAVVMPIEPKTDAAKANRKRAEDAGIRIVGPEEAKMKADIVVDALLGIGAKGALRGKIRDGCILINSLKAYKISIDVPTGIDADSGERDLDAVKPDATICIHAPKTGEMKAGKRATGELWIADIELSQE
jgi:hydroxyethylthiazole kinase-like uncharacterized protein yjeF